MIIGYLLAPLLGGVLAALIMLPFLLVAWKGPFELEIIAFAVTASTLGVCIFAYKGLLLVIPLSLTMRSVGFYGRTHWLMLGFLTAHLTGYDELYSMSEPVSTAVAAAAVSISGIACGFVFWLLVIYWPQKDSAV